MAKSNKIIIVLIIVIIFTFLSGYSIRYMSEINSGSDSQKILEKMESKTIQSVTEIHPGKPNHQVVIILPANGKIYHGTITWVASKPVLPAILHGPLNQNQENGQFVSSIDQDKTQYAITVAGPEVENGTYSFVGNALILHNAEDQQFWVSYSISYKEQLNTEMR